ncbi:hypothetical protein ElyMa_003529400 [Elysia marginata]|uniref:Uncharacterized protein n=1 Tax=Elysia marginata TaxID=1093978 RepID=A0AAV4EI70_9GAST|nr:hypothetical protein ElyMa_003529400 [Elysia marginata]
MFNSYFKALQYGCLLAAQILNRWITSPTRKLLSHSASLILCINQEEYIPMLWAVSTLILCINQEEYIIRLWAVATLILCINQEEYIPMLWVVSILILCTNLASYDMGCMRTALNSHLLFLFETRHFAHSVVCHNYADCLGGTQNYVAQA